MTTSNPTPLVLGAMMFGTRIDEETSFAVLDRFVERGGTWIDTADCYAFWESGDGHGGDSERLLGRWFAARPGVREQVRLATKLGAEPLEPGSWPARREGLAADTVRRAFAGSLERLGLDRVDLLWLHQEDRSVEIEETVDALGSLGDAVDRFGASNHPAWRVERARARASATGVRPIDAYQLNLSYLRPRPGTLAPGVVHRFGHASEEQLDHAREHAMDVWAYTPLLTGAYDDPGKALPEVFDHPGNARRLEALARVADDLGVTRGQVVLARLVANGITPMLGGSKVHQVDEALDGVALTLPDEHLELLDAVDRPEEVASPSARQ